MNNPAADVRPAIALVLCAAVVFAISDTVAKLLVSALHPVEVSWLRSVIVFALTVPAVMWRRGQEALRTRHPAKQVMRGLCILVSSLAFLAGLSHLPLADASAINFIWPLLITVLSVLFLGERVGIRRAAATLAGFAGMLLIMRPGSGAFQMAALYPVAAALLWATASVMTRGMTNDEPPETTIVWSAGVMLAGTTLLLPFVWIGPTAEQLALCLIVGVGSAAAHAMMVFAYGRAPASTVAPFGYTQLVWATICGVVVFGTFPDAWMLAGAAVIVASGLYTIHRERVRGVSR